MKRRLFVLALLLPPLLSGCVGAPLREQPSIDVAVPDRWSVDAAQGDVDSAWWNRFSDPVLATLIATALEHNHDLKAAAARIERATAEARIAGAELAPTVGVALGAARSRQNFIGLPIGGSGIPSATFSSFGVSVDVGWEADLWGRLRAGARAALAEVQASEADLRGARLSISAATAKLWFAILEARQQIALAEGTVDSFRLSAGQVRTRFEAGLRPALDLRLALSNLAGAEALLQLRRGQLDGAVRRLQILLGRYPDGSILDRFSVGELPPFPDPVPAGLPAELVARRPDLVASERRLAASGQRYLSARRALYPRLSLTGSGGTASDGLGDLLDGDFRVWSLVANLAQPLFQGGRLRAGVDRAEALEREVLEGHAARVLSAFSEVETALEAERILADRQEHLAEAAMQLVAARRLAEDRYQRGVGDYLVVLESQTRALGAESELLTVRRLRLDNRVDLHLALGGGFETPGGTS